MSANHTERPLLRIADAAEHLDLAPRTVRDYIAQGRLPAYRVAGQRAVRVRFEDVEALLEPIPAYRPDGGEAA